MISREVFVTQAIFCLSLKIIIQVFYFQGNRMKRSKKDSCCLTLSLRTENNEKSRACTGVYKTRRTFIPGSISGSDATNLVCTFKCLWNQVTQNIKTNSEQWENNKMRFTWLKKGENKIEDVSCQISTMFQRCEKCAILVNSFNILSCLIISNMSLYFLRQVNVGTLGTGNKSAPNRNHGIFHEWAVLSCHVLISPPMSNFSQAITLKS